MALRMLKAQFAELVDSMMKEGSLSGTFLELQDMFSHEPRSIAAILLNACKDTEKHLNQLEKLLNEDPIHYGEINKLVLEMKETSFHTGSLRVPVVAEQLHWYCRKKARDGCIRALTEAKYHFLYLRGKLEAIDQLHKKIIVMNEADEKK